MVKTRVAIVEDHPLVMEALRQQFDGHMAYDVVLELTHGVQLLEALRRAAVDLLLIAGSIRSRLFERLLSS